MEDNYKKTTLVNLKGRKPQELYVGEIYIGRPMYMGGWKLPGSPWQNPFRITPGNDRAIVIQKYRDWIKTQPRLLTHLEELRGKTLACWCYPEMCHGNVLIELLEESSNP